MQGKWRKVIESYQRVHAFLGANPPSAPASYAEPGETLAAVLATLGELATEQVSGQRLSQAEMRKRAVLVKRLREHHLRPIAAIARAELASVPGIDVALRMPSSGRRILGLIVDARSIRKTVAQHQSVFVRNGRPQDFLEKLDEAIVAVDDSVIGRSDQVGRHVSAKADIRKALRRGRRAVEMLDTIVRVAFEGQDGVLARWEIAKRVQSLPTSASAIEEQEEVTQPKLSAA